MLYFCPNSTNNFWPSPSMNQAFCWRALSPKGTAQNSAKVGSLPTK
jgi:hypothetical protein